MQEDTMVYIAKLPVIKSKIKEEYGEEPDKIYYDRDEGFTVYLKGSVSEATITVKLEDL